MKILLSYEFETTEEFIKHVHNMNIEEKKDLPENQQKIDQQTRKYKCNNKECGKEITKDVVSYCLSNSDIYDNKVYCRECQEIIKNKL